MSELAELHRSLGRMEGKIDTFIAQLGVQDERHSRLEGRVRTVEGRQHWYSGVAAAAGTLLGIVTSFVGKLHT